MTPRVLPLLPLALLLACGDSGAGVTAATDSQGSGDPTTNTPGTSNTPTTASEPTGTASDGSGSGTATAGMTTGPTTGTLTTGTTTAATTDATTGTSAGTATTDTTGTTGTTDTTNPVSSTTDGTDTGTSDTTSDTTTTGGDPCQGQMGGFDFSYIWVSNSPQGTVSKIDTVTAVEVARYRTGASPGSDPSRTSVNLSGDAVVVNRSGSITMIAARPDDCVDTNGNGMIDTSTGPGDIKPWGQDECVLWHVPLAGTGNTGPRPVGWDSGTLNMGTCKYENPNVWVGWYGPGNTGIFRKLDGKTGATLAEVSVPWSGASFGPYGGAIDAENDFWVIGWQQGPLIQIHGDDPQTVDVYPFPNPPNNEKWAYGMALDPAGQPWIASYGHAVNFDPATQQWTIVSTGNFSMRGLQIDTEGRAFFAVDASANFSCGIAVVDTVTKTVIAPFVSLPGCQTPVGVSIDAEGFVWVVDQGGWAYKVNPDTYQAQMVSGLVGPYTYSDMTGAGLNLQVFPQ